MKSGFVNILGVTVHDVSMDGAVSMLERMLTDGLSHQVVTVNPEFIMAARHNTLFRDVLNNASLSVPDGIGVVLAARILGKNLRERVTGVDLVERLTAVAGRKQFRIYFLGARDGVAQRAADILQKRYPGFIIAGTYGGSPSPNEEETICKRIRATDPDILFVAYGAPVQDLWIARNMHKLGTHIAIGIGGTFDFITGDAIRAPRWVQTLGMEWLHRLARQPQRWRRMLALPRFGMLVFQQFITGR